MILERVNNSAKNLIFSLQEYFALAGKAPKQIVRRKYRKEVHDQIKGQVLLQSLEQLAEENDIVLRQFIFLRERRQITAADSAFSKVRVQQEAIHLDARIAHERDEALGGAVRMARVAGRRNRGAA